MLEIRYFKNKSCRGTVPGVDETLQAADVDVILVVPVVETFYNGQPPIDEHSSFNALHLSVLYRRYEYK
jgi:hypothetical protein